MEKLKNEFEKESGREWHETMVIEGGMIANDLYIAWLEKRINDLENKIYYNTPVPNPWPGQ